MDLLLKILKWLLVKIPLGIILLYIFCIYVPVRFAVKGLSDIENKQYVAVHEVKVTGFEWAKADKSGYIVLSGRIPPNRDQLSIDWANIDYICYGEFLEPTVDPSNPQFGAVYQHFQVSDWDVMYPIERPGLLIPPPKSYFNLNDLISASINGYRYWCQP